MDLVDAIHIKSWIDSAKEMAQEEGKKVYITPCGGGFALSTVRGEESPVAEVWPGGMAILRTPRPSTGGSQ